MIVKQSKKTKSVEPKPVEPVELKQEVVVEKPKKEKKVVAPVEPVVENVVVPVEGSLQESFNGVLALLVDMNGLLSRVKAEVKVLERQVSKEMKVLDKINQKKNKNKHYYQKLVAVQVLVLYLKLVKRF